MTKVYAIYDVKAEAYMQPFNAETAGLALRSFAGAANDPQTTIGKFPTDFILYEIATFDEHTGRYESYPEPKHLGLAKEYVENVG